MRLAATDNVAAPFSADAENAIDRTSYRVTDQPPARTPKRPSVSTYEFSTLGLSREEQFGAWRSSYAHMVDLVEPVSSTTDNDFAGKQVIWDLGDLAFCHVTTHALGFASLAGHMRREPLDHWLISLMLDGSSKTVAPSRVFDCDAGSVQIHPLGRVFEGCLTNCEMLQLFVPRDFCRGMAHALGAAEFSTLDRGMATLFADYMISLARRLPSLDIGELPELVTATRAMILACIAPSPDHLDEANDPIANVLLDRARRFVQVNIFAPDLGATSLQRELGISRSRLYRLFEPHGGVVRYIQHRRLLEAHAALADPSDHRRILDIAEEHGFTGGAEFSRAFKREFGYSPSEARRGGKRRLPNQPGIDLETVAPGDRLEALLRRLQA